MNRADFGHWGAGLDADDFAMALAAAGALAAVPATDPDLLGPILQHADIDRPVRWRIPQPGEMAASTLADAWNAARAATSAPIRLGIELDWRAGDGDVDPRWLVDQLSRTAVAADAVVVLPAGRGQPIASEAWHWPLDAALLPDDASRALGDAIWRDHEVHAVVDLREIGPEHETCDLLLLPFGPREALARLLEIPVRASCVAILGAAGEPWERLRPMLQTIEALTRASALVLAPMPDERRAGWFAALVGELSRNTGLDIALDRISRGTPPLLIAPDRLLQRTRMGHALERAEAMTSMAMPPEEAAAAMEEVDSEVHVTANGGPHREFPRMEPAPPDVGATPRPPTAAARAVAGASRAARSRMPEPEPRFLRAKVTESGNERERVTTLSPRSRYDVRVSIGPASEEWVEAGTVFPDHALFTGDEREHRLRVFFTDLSMRTESMSQEIVLPRHGTSLKDAVFPLATGDGREPIEARIIVTHRNRVLQTVKLRARVGEPDSVSLQEEVVARARLDDLAGRSRFDLALVVNHTDAGSHRLTRITGDRADVYWPAALNEHLTGIRDLLDASVTKDVDEIPLRSAEMATLLVQLARNGEGLFSSLVNDLLGDDAARIAKAERIQIVAAEIDAYFPIEFAYDLPAPALDATPCPDAEQALRDGTCPACRGRSATQQRQYVCPLGFWGLGKVIERYAFDEDRSREVRADLATYHLLTEAVQGRNTIAPIQRMVFTASNKVDGYKSGTFERTARALRRRATASFARASTWETWEKKVAAIDPQLLVMLPHTGLDHLEPTMQVGEDAVLYYADIGPQHVLARTGATPIVLLLGCETASASIPLQKLPTRLRHKGAVIVLGTLTSILGRHAAPVAISLVDALMEMSTQERLAFGDVMKQVRQRALLEGNPMVLALAAYGDADWQFGA